MWSEEVFDSVPPPAPAQINEPFRARTGGNLSMGEDAYIHQPSGVIGREHALSDTSSTRTTSTAHLRGVGMGRTVSSSGGGIPALSDSSKIEQYNGGIRAEEDRSDGLHPGMPIGLLAAFGTRYAKKPIYRSRKCKILCPILGGVTAAITIIITLFPVLRAVAVHTLSTTVMSVSGSNITNPTNTSFALTLEGQAHKVGIFPAHLYFPNPISVFWIAPENLTQELQLGQFGLAPIGVAAGHGRIKQQTVFNITNEPAFARFTEYLITQSEFTWRLKSTEVQAKAFSFIAVNGLTFTKDLTLPGMANMTDVSISDFQLPGDDPEGGISLSVTTKLTNPSAFGVQMGTLAVALYYQGIYLGPAQTIAPINLTSGVNYIHLAGRMVPHTDNATELKALSTVFSNYLNGLPTPVEARGVSVTPLNGEPVDWLTKGVQALILQVPLMSPTGRIPPITSITIKELSLGFDPAQPYAPTTNSSHVDATFGLPFGFTLSIVELSNAFSIVDNKTAVTSLSSPMALADSVILTKTSAGTTGSLKLNLPISRLVTPPSYTDHLIFDQFNFDFTTTTGANFYLVGNSSVVTNTPIGQVLLTNIGFTVPAGLIGLNGLTQYPTEIISVDVVGGSAEAVLLNITVGMTNPSNLDLTVGDVTFQLYNGKDFIGTTVLPALHLVPGYQQHASIGYLQGNNNPGAHAALAGYAQGDDTQLTISGFNGSSACESLTQAFMAIHLNTTLKGLTTKLLNYANLTVLPTTGATNNFAASVVSLQNPFTAPLLITNIQSNITSHGIFVGSIVQDVTFPAAGKTASISPVLNFNLNLFPPDIFTLLRQLVVQTETLDPAPLDGIVALGGYTYVTSTVAARRVKRSLRDDYTLEEKSDMFVDQSGSGSLLGDRSDVMFASSSWSELNQAKVGSMLEATSGIDSESTLHRSTSLVARSIVKRNLYTGFDLPSYVLTAFKGLTVTVDLLSVLHIGDFTTNLAYSQSGVPAHTDSSLTLLLPILARPIVQRIVDGSNLGVKTVMISSPTNAAFTTGLVGSITSAGPFDAVISFPAGLTVAWNGAPLGQIAMPNVALVADVGAQLDISAAFNVLDLAHLTDFTAYLLTEPSFTWQIYGQNLSVTALGITVDGIGISKNVVLDGMNGFRGNVKINSFDLPSNDAAGGITLVLQTTLTNPSSVGVELSTIGFMNYFGSTNIGPAASTAPFSLLPKATIQLPLSGRLIPQTTDQGLHDVSTIFNGYLHGVPADLVVHGDTAGPADVSWLNDGIKKLAIAVILPAAVNLQVINSITLNQLTLLFTESTAYAPAFSTSNTVADFQLPFAFPVDISQIQTAITIGSGSAAASRLAKRDVGDFALLNVPLLPAKTDVIARTTLLTFQNVPFTSTANDLFSAFLLATTDGTSVTMKLHGAANTITSTAIGNLNLEDIAFSVDTSLLGLQGLNARPATVSELDVAHGYPTYLQINVNAHLYNPSNITIGTGDVAFGLSFQGQMIGTANILGLVLIPGENVIATQVHYQPSGGASTASGQVLLENFIQGVASDTQIVGSQSTTPIVSLQPALGSITLATTIPPVHSNLITQANLAFPIDIGQTGVANANFVLANPFSAAINLITVITTATYNGINLGEINQQNLNPPIHAGGHTQITSPTLPLALNTDPRVLIAFLESAAAAQGVDLGILLPEFAYVLSLASTASPITTSVNLQPETCAPTGTTRSVEALILAAVKNLKTNLTIQSVVALDDYNTPLNFVQNNVDTVLDDSVLYLTALLGKTIVSHIVDDSTLAFSQGLVTNVTDNGFTAALKGALLNVGPFDALIEFPDGVQVMWQGSHIANIALPSICSSGGSGIPDLETTGILTIANLDRFTDFATYILLNPGFTWTISTNTLRVLALGTIFDGITLTKDISFTAFNGLPGVSIFNPDFPGDAPDGIQLVTDSFIPSPSNLGIELGHATFIASYEGQEVGPIDAFNLVLAPLATTLAHLTGTIIKRTSDASTASLGVLFSQFLAGQNQTLQVAGQQVVTPAQPNSPVNWLSAAFKKLVLPVVLPGHVYDIISSVKLLDLTVTIKDQSEAYSVPTQNNETDVVYKNPFGFSLTAIQAGGSFVIYNGVDTGVLTLPVANAVSAQTSTGQNANLVLDFKSPQILQSLDTTAFNTFFNAITNTQDVSFGLHGAANVTAQTNAGNIPITGIPFSVTTDLLGLESLNSRPTVVSNLDVYHGYPTYLQINADASLYNPSSITIVTDHVIFGLSFQGQIIGTVVIGDLLLIPGVNNLATAVHYSPSGGASTVAGETLLANYVQGITSDVSIVGTPDSTPYGSLQEALGTISIQTSIPALHQLLITEASLSFPIDIATTGIAQASFALSNPFTASVNLIDVIANATYQNFFLGQINSQNLSPEISAGGHSNITSRSLPFELTTDPKFLIQFLEAAATAQGVNLGILIPEFAYVLSQPESPTTVTSAVNPNAETCHPTGSTATVDALILAAVKNLKTDLFIQTTLSLDDYVTNLNFAQLNIPTVLDDSVLYLTGLLGKKIVSNIVDQSTLSFSGGLVSNVTDNGFTVALQGSLLNAGPFDALIEFPFGLEVYWQGSYIANIDLPSICSPGGIAVPNLQTTGILTIVDLARFTDFASYILLNPSFEWTVTTPKLRVLALGTIFDNVLLSKKITFDAFNKLASGVTISHPDFPGDAPNGIKLSLDSLIPSPSNLGIVLGDVSFIASFEGQQVGPVIGSGLTLPPKSITALPLTGTILATTSQPNLNALGVLFSQFLAGKNSTLQVTGNSVVSPAQPGSPVTWLSAAFKTLTLDVNLPGMSYVIIFKIQLLDLAVTIDNVGEAYAALVTNNKTNVVYKNPFGFSLTAVQAGGDFIINYNGVDTALLTVPVEDSVSAQPSSGADADLVINILTPAVLSSLNNNAFASFFDAVTNTADVGFRLHGGANVTALTAAGRIPIGGIQFDVETTFPGIDGFSHEATIPAVPVVIGGGGAGGSEYLAITLDVILTNPAPLILHTNMVSFEVIYGSTIVGRALIDPLDLYKGLNKIPSVFHYQPADPGSVEAQSLLAAYLEKTSAISLVVQGDTSSSPYGSLQLALSHITLPTSFPGQGIPIVHNIIITLDLFQAACGYSSFTTSLVNNLECPISVQTLMGTASQNGVEYATYNTDFGSTPLNAAPGGQASAQSVPVPAKLVRGALGSAPLLAGTTLDIAIKSRVSIGGYIAPSLSYFQNNVPYTINYAAGGLTLSQAGLTTLLSNPAAALGLVSSLQSVTTCNPTAGGIPSISLIPNAPGLGAIFSQLPAPLQSILDGGVIPTALLPTITLPTVTIPAVSLPSLPLPVSLAAVTSSIGSAVASVVGNVASAAQIVPVVVPAIAGLGNAAATPTTAARSSAASTSSAANVLGVPVPALPLAKRQTEDEAILLAYIERYLADQI